MTQTKSCPQTLRIGAESEEVRYLQQQLNSNGYKLDTDAIFGEETQEAVKDFQAKNSLSVDGIVGPHTWHQLRAC